MNKFLKKPQMYGAIDNNNDINAHFINVIRLIKSFSDIECNVKKNKTSKRQKTPENKYAYLYMHVQCMHLRACTHTNQLIITAATLSPNQHQRQPTHSRSSRSIHMHVYTRTNICIYIYGYMYICIYVYTYTDVHIYMYIFTYVCKHEHKQRSL